MSLKQARALGRLRALRASIEREGLPAEPNVYHVAALTGGLIEILRGAGARRASACATYLFRIAPASFTASGVEQTLACKRGCSYCCHGYVSASAPQIFAAAEAIRARALSFEAACERIRAAAAEVRGLGWRERIALRRACPLLENAACSIYPARPLACRGYASTSLAACERAFERLTDAVPLPPQYANVRSALESALRAALTACALPAVSYELNGALAAALADAGAEGRWLAGEPVFDSAVIDTSADAEALQRSLMLDTLIGLARGEQPATLTASRPG